MTRDIKPYGFWPWFWAISALATVAWPAWLAGASSAMFKLTGVATYYTWCAIVLVAVLLVFYFSNVIYHSLSKIFIAVMWINRGASRPRPRSWAWGQRWGNSR